MQKVFHTEIFGNSNGQILLIVALMIDLTSNDLFGRAIWDKLPEYIFENFEIARAIQGQFRIFENPEGDLFQELPK